MCIKNLFSRKEKLIETHLGALEQNQECIIKKAIHKSLDAETAKIFEGMIVSVEPKCWSQSFVTPIDNKQIKVLQRNKYSKVRSMWAGFVLSTDSLVLTNKKN